MNTGKYITSDSILFTASAMSGDKGYKALPRGFYQSLIQEAFEELNLDSFFEELRVDIEMPTDTLTLKLPEGCFNVKNIYMFNGDECNINSSRKVWWKRNYFTKGSGYIANDKGNNGNDPYYGSRSRSNNAAQSLDRTNNSQPSNSVLFYNIQMGELMLSSSCRGAGNKVHIHYNGIGGDINEAPIIPIFFRTAMEDYVIEAALRFRMADEPSMAKNWSFLQQTYSRRLDKDGMDGSWHKAVKRVQSMNASQREELKEYLGRSGYARGF